MAAEGAVITAVVVAEARMVVVAEVALMAAEGRVEAVPTVTNCSACSPPERRAGFFFARCVREIHSQLFSTGGV
jgi:hypothetical protein